MCDGTSSQDYRGVLDVGVLGFDFCYGVFFVFDVGLSLQMVYACFESSFRGLNGAITVLLLDFELALNDPTICGDDWSYAKLYDVTHDYFFSINLFFEIFPPNITVVFLGLIRVDFVEIGILSVLNDSNQDGINQINY